MQWQDWVFSIGGWIFVFSLIPTILGKQKPELSTSLLSSIVIYIFSYTYYSLGLKISAFSVSVSGTCWAILAYQRYKQPKK